MTKLDKHDQGKNPANKPTKAKKEGELTDEDLKKISGGPTAVEMPGRFTQ